MKAAVVVGEGQQAKMEAQEVEIPAMRPGDVLIRVEAAGVCGPDLVQKRGDYPPPPGASPLLGLEVSGCIVDATTEGASLLE